MPGAYRLRRVVLAWSNTPDCDGIEWPARRRVVFRRRDNAVLLKLRHQPVLGKLESSEDVIAATIALQVT